MLAEKYKLNGNLGKGGFGTVFKAVSIQTNEPLAAKFVRYADVPKWAMTGGNQNVLVPFEIVALQKCSDVSGVVKLVDWIENSGGYWLIMERPMPCVDLFEYTYKKGILSEIEARCIFIQLIKTLLDCASCNIFHLDVKPDNILINTGTNAVKLIDFGSTEEARFTYYTEFYGTLEYGPPEWFQEGRFRAGPSIVWSLGVMLFEMLCGDLPFSTRGEVVENKLIIKAHLSSQCQDLIKKCLTTDPEHRIEFGDSLLLHPWFHVNEPFISNSIAFGNPNKMESKKLSKNVRMWQNGKDVLTHCIDMALVETTLLSDDLIPLVMALCNTHYGSTVEMYGLREGEIRKRIKDRVYRRKRKCEKNESRQEKKEEATQTSYKRDPTCSDKVVNEEATQTSYKRDSTNSDKLVIDGNAV